MKTILSVRFVQDRCTHTGVAQNILFEGTGWVWFDKPVAGWSTDLDQLRSLDDSELGARTIWQIAANTWGIHARQVQDRTRELVALGRIRFRKNADAASLFRALRTGARSRPAILAQAQAARDAWAQTDPAWVPSDGFTLTVFSTEIEWLFTLQATHSQKQIAWKGANNALMNKAREVDADCVAWYTEALRRFPVGTSPGDVLRSMVPTTYRRAKEVAAVELSVTATADGGARVELSAAGATKFSLWQRAPEAEEWKLISNEVKTGALDLAELDPGLHAFKAQGRNSRRKGPECAPVELLVQAALAG